MLFFLPDMVVFWVETAEAKPVAKIKKVSRKSIAEQKKFALNTKTLLRILEREKKGMDFASILTLVKQEFNQPQNGYENGLKTLLEDLEESFCLIKEQGKWEVVGF